MWEQAWSTLAEQKYIVLNVMLTSAAQITIAILATDMILRRKHSPVCQLIYLFAKVSILDILFYILLRDYLNQHFGLSYFLALLKVGFSVVFILVQRYTYDAGFIKCCLYSLATELCAVCIGASSMILAGNMDKSMENMYFSSISWNSLKFLLFSFSIFYIFRFIVRRFFSAQMERLKDHTIKYEKFWTVIWMFYIGTAVYQNMPKGQLDLASSYRMGVVMLAVLAIGTIFFIAWIYRKYQDQIRQEHEFLNIKQNLMVLHMKAVRQQILDMENEQRMIDQQMENIQQIGNFEGIVQIENYLRMLKNQYRKIQAGMYTDDVFVDSVLYYADMLRRKKRELEISFAQYQKNSLDEMCAGKILMCLMEAVLVNSQQGKQGYKVRLYGGTVKNQVIFQLEYNLQVNKRMKERTVLQKLRHLYQSRKIFKTLRRCVKQFGGSMQISENENRLKIETILAGRNNSTETNVSCLEIQL